MVSLLGKVLLFSVRARHRGAHRRVEILIKKYITDIPSGDNSMGDWKFNSVCIEQLNRGDVLFIFFDAG